MKSIKKLVGLLVITTSIVCTGCGSVANQKLTPVEESGKQASITGLSVEIPKGWSEEEGIITQSGLVMTKGVSTITILKEDAPGLSEQDIDTTLANLKTLYENPINGVELLASEVETLEVGDAAVFKFETEVTQEFVDQNVENGLYTEEVAKSTKAYIGKTNNEIIMYLCIGDTIVTIDGVTYTGDVAGIEEVVTFVANSITLS